MEHLWAPWRMTYIEGPRPPGCFFCQAAGADQSQEAEHLVVARSERCLAILNRYPYNNGHLMVAPLAHLGVLEDLEPAIASDLMALTQRAIRVLRSVLTPEGFNVGINLGKVAGAGVIDHVHQHVVPRWNGDTNYMPVIGEVKVLGEHLERSYEKIRAGFDNMT